ncbi:peptide/nickel transport system permease protein/oligopeptide transport system permease protein [Tamaricihabitans halophyticus]|uniref:Peptide/nickel transport system permease protein/oligopeptide transport system permease protein n=1 Tax=Tamaricihabitans halophyticus TaxID=1262583 RepID=A0A4R2QEZ2_9PSEU|nr:ABC transporter permease [Tamaricihabitans halophyticus]TCP47229.1 peptide/nickel transport system permease protein/oligopeptide transport system permease protein [Tamaricihabitans halophyticus]
MIAFIGRRLGLAVLLIFGAITIVFLALRVIPGDPASLILGSQASEAELAALRTELGLNEPLFLQYLHHLADLLRLDFGESWRLGADALSSTLERVPATFTLAGTALLITIGLGFPLGLYAARNAGGWGDRLVSYSSLVGQALPSFWVGIMLVLVFASALNLLPSTADGTIWGLLLPAVTLSLPFLGWLARLVRNGALEELGKEYVRTARSKGMSERVVFYVHVLRNTLTPAVTVLGLILGNFIADAVIIEVVFAWPGIGSLLIDSITNRDYAVAEAAIVLIAACYILLNLLVDVLCSYLDPRISLEAV